MSQSSTDFDDGEAYDRFMGRWSRAAGGEHAAEAEQVQPKPPHRRGESPHKFQRRHPDVRWHS